MKTNKKNETPIQYIGIFLNEKASNPSKVTKNTRERPKIFEYVIFNLSSCSHLKIVP